MGKNQPISNDLREKICKLYLAQHRMKEISELFNVHKSTITRIIKRFTETDSFEFKKKGGRRDHKRLNDEQLEQVRQHTLKNRDITLKNIQQYTWDQFGINISLGTAFNVMKRIRVDTNDKRKRRKPQVVHGSPEPDIFEMSNNIFIVDDEEEEQLRNNQTEVATQTDL